MRANEGDWIAVESEHAGRASRSGQIVMVLRGRAGPYFRVRWTDGHSSLFFPESGAAFVLTPREPVLDDVPT